MRQIITALIPMNGETVAPRFFLRCGHGCGYTVGGASPTKNCFSMLPLTREPSYDPPSLLIEIAETQNEGALGKPGSVPGDL